ncbi:2-oxoglutarate dehydrogenase complex dihydrolipoyllysine-residue succinyltransferase [Pelodictyon phaeoclathratiforme]|jgi:2-oxoglutarate dehydrogenase E2 component (dihydrolipoamide succinyltransferase)|uniref:Dihydrolipoyllysine-residue succinyltransferase component of 2-oxoglutarate dehydrogenase complex n=1 Tax=Pelodictyon phaeoclathratiforme (strain DSM 5477 / BU-1) TaxID=324925 RepID=B4SCL8_PELPB|nr:2-oxoglutarate dehydrogenase complex dihydrolipoyllysine-residue succinyltransferase [Pelodictyon phaeoclathratiforme]ACF44223.1 2-oxoglutarate dehydrogenase, E2 subunit, dihydrolipoamide succinyltransferase [Pelodictyon phaeoclathratiforme BU-1]MBV5288589.1 2-oxoglutarate dehydrogenase complex dihydrolipoyllysine-residue succinyltransferase [Pelodictyon phaeoclathratiforme]
MAIIDVTISQLSESVAEATLLNWKKKPGDGVVEDEILFEIETDKVVFDVPSPASGVLFEILVGDGGTVVPNQVLARIDSEGKATVTAQEEAIREARAPEPTAVEAEEVIVMPAAAKLMAETGIKLSQVEGTGRQGRVTKGDVLQAIATDAEPSSPQPPPQPVPRPAPTPAPAPAPAQKPKPVEAHLEAPLMTDRPEQRVPMTRLRARIAERLLQSQASNAILTTFNEVNMQGVIELRNRYKATFEKEHGVKLGFVSFFVKAAVHALRKYPVLNASVDGKDIIYHGYFDIGIAVSSPRGLVVPILRNADQMTIADIERKIADYSTKAKLGNLSLEELTGGTFSISNGGVFGSMLSTPIINPPQSAILGIHATKERAVVENGQIVIRPMNYLAMSYDHRIIDGREAVLGLSAIKDALEDPARLLLDL